MTEPFSLRGPANWRLLRTLALREIQARYRGSSGELWWAILNPLLLMGTYVFVFGFVLRARFPGESTSTGYILAFLAGLIPWLGVNEGLARAPIVMVENRNIVKRLVFPLEILPLVPIAAGLITQAIVLAIWLVGFVIVRGVPPVSAVQLPILLAIQIATTVGLAWLMAATGVFLRDLGQAIGFLLTLVFFLSPICYPESALPAWAAPVLRWSPVYFLVTSYRAVLIEGKWLNAGETAIFAGVAGLLWWMGWKWFAKLRGSFPDAL